jgi:hypothetical protein
MSTFEAQKSTSPPEPIPRRHALFSPRCLPRPRVLPRGVPPRPPAGCRRPRPTGPDHLCRFERGSGRRRLLLVHCVPPPPGRTAHFLERGRDLGGPGDLSSRSGHRHPRRQARHQLSPQTGRGPVWGLRWHRDRAIRSKSRPGHQRHGPVRRPEQRRQLQVYEPLRQCAARDHRGQHHRLDDRPRWICPLRRRRWGFLPRRIALFREARGPAAGRSLRLPCELGWGHL